MPDRENPIAPLSELGSGAGRQQPSNKKEICITGLAYNTQGLYTPFVWSAPLPNADRSGR